MASQHVIHGAERNMNVGSGHCEVESVMNLPMPARHEKHIVWSNLLEVLGTTSEALPQSLCAGSQVP